MANLTITYDKEQLAQAVAGFEGLSLAKIISVNMAGSKIQFVLEVDATNKQVPETCKWTFADLDANEWDSECGHAWLLEVDTPKDNEMNFCCFCGKVIEQVPYQKDDDDDEEQP